MCFPQKSPVVKGNEKVLEEADKGKKKEGKLRPVIKDRGRMEEVKGRGEREPGQKIERKKRGGVWSGLRKG